MSNPSIPADLTTPPKFKQSVNYSAVSMSEKIATTTWPQNMGEVTSVAPSGELASGDPEPDRFILLAGAAFAGKTTAALTFPSPLVLNFDNKLPYKGINHIPFYDDDFCDSIVRRTNQLNPANRRDALANWLQSNMSKLKGRTVIVDSATGVETAFYQQTFEVEKKWGVNGGLFFGSKLSYFSSLCAMLQATGAKVIFICHLLPVFAKDVASGADVSTGKFKPALAGSFAEKLPTFATTVAFAYRRTTDFATGATSFFWALRPTMAFDSCTLAKNIPATGEIDVTANAYEAFRKCF
jgi:hypothetical protein